MESDLISIIIPVYNAEKYILQTIDTIKEQTYKNWEAIFIDDVSIDDSKNIIKNNLQKNIKLIELQENKGPAIARNVGLQYAKGRYIAFLDADDLWTKNKLEIQLKYMKENDWAFSYSEYWHINKDGKKAKKSISVPKELNYKEGLKKIRILTITSMFDTEKINKDMLLMPDINGSEDIATWWNILKAGYIAYGIDKPLAFYRKTKGTKSYNKVNSMKSRWKIYRIFEKLSIIKTMYYYVHYIINAIERRL